MSIDISGIPKAKLLVALFNASSQQGMGFMKGPVSLTEERAQELIDAGQTYFEYLGGRVMKVEIGGNTMDEFLYDRDNGTGAAASVVKELRPQI